MKTINAEEELVFGGYEGLEPRYYTALGLGMTFMLISVILSAVAGGCFYAIYFYGMNYMLIGTGIASIIFLPFALYMIATLFMDVGTMKELLKRKRSKVNYNK